MSYFRVPNPCDPRNPWLVLLCLLILPLEAGTQETAINMTKPFPALMPLTKPTDRPLSSAMARMYDEWNPHEDRGNELFSNFRYSKLEGFDYPESTSRRDPSKILKIDSVYHVWYTRRQTAQPPNGAQNATDTIPSTDWDLAEIWHATSHDGFVWEEQGVAVKRAPADAYGWRSVSTPDVLAWGGKFYLYFQGFNEIPGLKGDRAAVTVAEADSPEGPWRSLGRVVVDFGKPGEWDSNAIHDPYPLVFNGKIHLYYKGGPGKQDGAGATVIRAQGVATADHPLGPFTKSPLNPVINSGHETGLFPYREGVASIISLDGPEKNTIQYAPDGVNFTMQSIIQVPPMAPGPFVADAFADNRNGRGITWGLCHINPTGGGGAYSADDSSQKRTAHARKRAHGWDRHCILARFDCDLSRDVERPIYKQNNLRFERSTYEEPRIALSQGSRERRRKDNDGVERDTILVDQSDQRDGSPPVIEPYQYPTEASPKPSDVPADTPPFPAKMSLEKPTDRPLSASWARMWDRWNPLEDRGNDLYSNFKYSRLEGLSQGPEVSRRDPTKVLRIDGVYHVWYTRRATDSPPVPRDQATDTIPATDWDLADIWHATSRDGFTWKEQGLAVHRPPKPGIGWRSICTPDVLIWKARYYLYFQAYSDVCVGTIPCPVRVASAASVDGPWTLHDEIPIAPGPEGSWDNIKINDPYLLVHRGRIHLYYKGAPIERGDDVVLRMQGVAMCDNPLGPFEKSPVNPVLNSGHETGFFPWKEGVAAIVSLDGPEKNTIQWSPDGENFELMSIIQVPPVAPGPCVPDAFADNGDGRGVTWGLCHINPDGGGSRQPSILARFDCDLSQDVDWQDFKKNNLRFQTGTHFQPRLELPAGWKMKIIEEQGTVDCETVMGRNRD